MKEEIKRLYQYIRYGHEPDNPMLLNDYFRCSNHDINAEKDVVRKRELYESQYNLLISTVCDRGVPKHWKEICLDYVYRPLSKLYEIADNEESLYKVSLMFCELQNIEQYFHPEGFRR